MKTSIITLLLISYLSGFGQTNLSAHSLFFTHVNADAPKGFSFTFNSNIDASTQIFFTDAAWLNSTNSFISTEGTVCFTASRSYNAGDIICFANEENNEFEKNGSFNPSTSGDNIIAYQIQQNDTVFIAGIGWGRRDNWTYNESSNTSEIPNNISVIQLGTSDNYILSDSLFSLQSIEDIDDLLTDPDNFIGNNDISYTQILSEFDIQEPSITIPVIETPCIIDSVVCFNETYENLRFNCDNIMLFTDAELTDSIDQSQEITDNEIIYAVAYQGTNQSNAIICNISIAYKSELTQIDQIANNILYCESASTTDWYKAQNNEYIYSGDILTITEIGDYYAIYTDEHNCEHQTEIKSITSLENATNISHKIQSVYFDIYSLSGIKIFDHCLKNECNEILKSSNTLCILVPSNIEIK